MEERCACGKSSAEHDSCGHDHATAHGKESPTAAEAYKAQNDVILHRGYGAAHGDKCFTSAVVATAHDGTILAASIDEYLFVEADRAGMVGVPNSDAALAKGYGEGQVLISKRHNNEAYSRMMQEQGPATVPWLTSMRALEAYCVGKRPAELANAGLEAVSGATLVDTPNYFKLVAEVACNIGPTTTGSYAGDGADLKLGRVNASAHGPKAFAEAVTLVQGDVIVAASIDEFLFIDASIPGWSPVPNSDKAFGKGCAPGVALMSKWMNSDLYSAMIREHAPSVVLWADSMAAIESFLAGMKIDEAKVEGPDAVSGATLMDTAGYVRAAALAGREA